MKRNITVYIVGHNMAGYLGDNDPYIVTGKRRAISASREDAIRDLQAYNSDLPKEYRKDHTYHMSGRNGDYWLTAKSGASYHYWVTEADAELVDEASDGQYRNGLQLGAYCTNCERDIPGEEAYYVSLCDCYLCMDCAS